MKKIKLSDLSERKMRDKQMDVVNGGYDTCGCSCYYEGQQGGSSIDSNFKANRIDGLHSVKGEAKIMAYRLGINCKTSV